MSLTYAELVGLQMSRYSHVGGVAILIFNYAITLDEEVRWIWGRNWDVTRIVFMVSRYLPFVSVGLTGYTGSCDPYGLGVAMAENFINILSITASEVLLILRTYAFWQGDKRVLYGLLGYACVSLIATIMTRIFFMPLRRISADGLCFSLASPNAAFEYMILLIFELVILSLTIYRRFCAYRGAGTTGIIHVLYRDGVFYIVSIALITFANAIVDGVLPFQYTDLLESLQLTLHSVLASRIMFNLRKSYSPLQAYTEEIMHSGGQVFSDVVFDQPNMGPIHKVSMNLGSGFEMQGMASSCISVDAEPGNF